MEPMGVFAGDVCRQDCIRGGASKWWTIQAGSLFHDFNGIHRCWSLIIIIRKLHVENVEEERERE
jgi:hypothetical protein